MTNTSPQLDTLTPADIHACWQMCQALRWPHREADLLRFLQWSQQHGAALALRADGKLTGCGFAFFWGETHGSIGMVIVDDAWQGKGLGKQLFNRLLEAQGARSVTLQATQAGLPLYQKMGFHAVGRARQFHGIWRPDAAAAKSAGTTPSPLPAAAEGIGTGTAQPASTSSPAEASAAEASAAEAPAAGHGAQQPPATPCRLHALQPQDIPALLAWDSAARGITRQWLLEDLLKGLQPDERCTVSTGTDGRPDGYGVLRRFGRGWVLGPLLAQDEAHAQALIEHLTAEHAGEFIRIDLAADVLAFAEHGADVPAPALGEWLQSQGLAMVDEPVTMVKPGADHAPTAPVKQEKAHAHASLTPSGSAAAPSALHTNATLSGIASDRADEQAQPHPSADSARTDAPAGVPLYHTPRLCALIAQAIS